jgi:RimJ/RimL family protein N-acetyltransferase
VEHAQPHPSDRARAADWWTAASPAVPAGIGLRPESESDVPFVRGLYVRLRMAELAPLPWPDAAKCAFLSQQFALQRRHFQNGLAASVFLIITVVQPPSTAVEIGRLYVDRAAPIWSIVDISFEPAEQRKGFGTALLRWVQSHARNAGADGVELYVAIDNPRAKALYRKLGFEEIRSESATHHKMLWTVAAR